MSKVYKSSNITIDADKRVKINVEPIASPVKQEEEIESDEVISDEQLENPEELVENARSDAKRILEMAEKQADDIINKAKVKAEGEADRIKAEAEKKGYDAGYNSGALEAETLKDEALKIKEDAYVFKDEVIAEAEPQVVEMIVSLMDKLLTDEVEINPRLISILVKQGLKQATMTGNITVHVSKDDYKNVLAEKDDILSSFETMASVDFVEDASLKKSDCIIETDLGSIDCGLKNQFRELKKNIYYLLNAR